jgi:hypothetical protein
LSFDGMLKTQIQAFQLHGDHQWTDSAPIISRACQFHKGHIARPIQYHNDALYGKQTLPLAVLMSTAKFAAVTHKPFSYWRKFAKK